MKMKIPAAALADILRWDVFSWSRALSLWEQIIPTAPGGPALEIGSRDGGLALFLALHGRRVICSDLNSPQSQAEPVHRRYGVANLVDYAALNATAIDLPAASVAIACFKSVIGAIGGRGGWQPVEQAWSEIHRVLKPGGLLLFAENLRATPLHAWLRRHFVPWGGNWSYPTPTDILRLLDCYSETECRYFGFTATMGRSEWQRRSLAFLDSALDPLLPQSAKYIAYGWARR